MIKSTLVTLILTSLTASGLLAANTLYPAQDIRFKELSAVQADGRILEITKPAIKEDLSRWCAIDIPVPGELKYNPDLVIEGKARIETTEAPSHLACLFITSEGKTGFILLIKNPTNHGPLTFKASTQTIVVTDTSKSQEPFNDNDVIKKLSLYVSFSGTTQTKLTLDEFILSIKK